MGKDLICERLERYREAAKQKCVTLDVTPDDFIDDEHLDCLWYDGAYAFLKYKDMDVVLSVQGEVTLKGTCGGREIFYRNSYRGPDPCADLDCQIRDDVELYRLLGAEWAEEKEDHLILEDNNWIESFCGDAG